MQCTFCDANLDPGARFCPQCGTVVEEPAGAYDPYAAKPGPEPYAAPVVDPYATPQAPFAIPAAPPPTSNLAVISLVSGIAAWFVIPLLGAIAAIITGHMARREIRDSHGRVGGDSMAIIGLILGYVQIVLAVLLLLLVVVIVAAVGLAARNGG